MTFTSFREDIFATITNTFGIHIKSFSEIKLGYLDLKWKITTNIGHLFVKQYNQTRYPDISDECSEQEIRTWWREMTEVDTRL